MLTEFELPAYTTKLSVPISEPFPKAVLAVYTIPSTGAEFTAPDARIKTSLLLPFPLTQLTVKVLEVTFVNVAAVACVAGCTASTVPDTATVLVVAPVVVWLIEPE